MIINKIQRVLYMFVPNKPCGSLLEISPTNGMFLKTFNSGMMKMKYCSQMKIVNHKKQKAE